MSLRDKFLNDFILLSETLKDSISVYYVIDFENAFGITFSELNRLSDKLSSYFSEIFDGNNPYIGVFLEDYFHLPCIILSIWKSGRTFSGLGKQYSKANTLYFLNALKVKYLITDTNIENDEKLISEFCIQNRKFFIWERHKVTATNNNLKDICYGTMTSGTTGDPKVIHVPWSCILPNAVELADKFGVTETDCVFQASPCSFDPFFIELFFMLIKGCSLMIVLNSVKLDSKKLLKILFCNSIEVDDCAVSNDSNAEINNYFYVNIKQLKKPYVTILQMTPSVFKLWSDSEIKEQILSSFSPLRVLVLGGEKFPKNILNLKDAGNKTRIFNIYGITEISCWAFLHEVENLDEDVSLGKPLNNIVYKISPKGELYLGSSYRICFIGNKSVEGVVFRNSKDVVALKNDKLYYIGRSNQIVKKYGIKINLTKIENAFINEKIKECHCVYMEECKKLGLFFVPHFKTNETNLKHVTYEYFCENFGSPKIDILSDIEKPDCLVEILKMPLNHHGKTDKKKLLQYLTNINKSHVPCDELENVFRNHWKEVLNLKGPDFSLNNFIEVGGSSLLALQLINRLTDAGFKVPENFISQLLNRESYGTSFESFKNAQNKDERKESVSRKRKRFSAPTGDVKLVVRWKFGLGKCVDATPSVFTYQGEERIVVGSHSSKLSCVNADSGREIWTISLGDRIESGFTTNKDKTKGYIGCYDHFVYCIALSDGTFVWKFKTGDMIKSTPCLSTDQRILYVASYDTKLYCLSTDTGEALQVIKLSDGGIYSSGIVSDSLEMFFIATLKGTCVSLNEKTNKIIWKISFGSPVFASPCLLESKREIVFAEVVGIVHCLDAISGAKVWMFKADHNIYSSPVAHRLQDVIHILFGCHDEHLYCLKYHETVELKWKCQVNSPIFGKPLVLSKSPDVCSASTKGFVYLCDLNSGSMRGHLELDGEVFSSVVHSGNLLFVGCRDDNIYCVDVS